MANIPISNITTTWTDSGTTYTGVKLNVTDTASASGSLLMDLQVGGTSTFKVEKDGKALAGDGNGDTVAGFRFQSQPNVGMFLQTTNIGGGSNIISFRDTSNVFLASGSNIVRTRSNYGIGWATGDANSSNPDVTLWRDTANTLAQRNGINPQTFRVYNTYTDASNYERGFVRWNSSALEVGAEEGGSGTARSCRFGNIATGEYFETNPNGTPYIYSGGSRFTFGTYYFAFGTAAGAADVGISRPAAGIVRVSGSASTNGGSLEFLEQTAPSAPSADAVRIYAEDNGSGKTRLMALFPTGAAQQIAIEP